MNKKNYAVLRSFPRNIFRNKMMYEISLPERYAVLIIIRKDFVLHMYKIVPEMVGYTNELGISMEKYLFKAIWFIIKGRYSQYS